MIVKCPNCNGPLVFDAVSGKMKCEHCNTYHEPEAAEKQTEREFNVFRCTSCGAEVAISQVECATYCAFCGQPTIVFNRVSKGMRPHGIIPFSVTKEEAIQALRNHVRKGFYIPKQIKNFEVERVVGIYLPFWVFDVFYADKQRLRYKTKKHTYYYKRDAAALFHYIPEDAATNFEDELAQRLWPFDWSKIVPFEEGYLSGFYADCYDQQVADLRGGLFRRCKALFDKESSQRVSRGTASIIESNPRWEIKDSRYLMLPAWCLTIRYEGVPYTMLVNGQTKSVVGALPFEKGKALATFILAMIPCTIIQTPIVFAMLSSVDFEDILKLFVCFAIALFSEAALGISWWSKLTKHIKHASSANTLSYGMRK